MSQGDVLKKNKTKSHERSHIWESKSCFANLLAELEKKQKFLSKSVDGLLW